VGSWSQDVGRQGGHGAEDRREQEDATLGAAGVPNNNYIDVGGEPRGVVRYTNADGIGVRPDGVTEKAWVDVKSTERPVLYNTEQLRAEKEGAQATGREFAVVIMSDDKDAIRPSSPLVDDADTILHRDTADGSWCGWDAKLQSGAGDWRSIDVNDARAVLGVGPREQED